MIHRLLSHLKAIRVRWSVKRRRTTPDSLEAPTPTIKNLYSEVERLENGSEQQFQVFREVLKALDENQ